MKGDPGARKGTSLWTTQAWPRISKTDNSSPQTLQPKSQLSKCKMSKQAGHPAMGFIFSKDV